MKKVIAILLCIFMIASLCSCSKEKSSDNINNYEEYLAKEIGAYDFMPESKEFGNFEKFQITHKTTYELIFITSSLGAFLTYDDEEFQKQCSLISEKYKFYNEFTGKLDNHTEYKGYEIKRVVDKYYLEPLKNSLLIGINKEDKKICYLYYYDSEVDIMDNLEEYIHRYFKFK